MFGIAPDRPQTESINPYPHAGIPLSFARSSLFSVQEQSTERLLSHELPVPRGLKYILTYTGPRLNQQHSLMWQAVVTLLIAEHGADKLVGGQTMTLKTSRRKLLLAAGKTDTSRVSREWAWETLKELQSGQLELSTPRSGYSNTLLGALVEDRTGAGKFEIDVDGRMIDLLRDEVATIDLKRKASLGRSQLALWLHDFISTQANHAEGRNRYYPWPVKVLHQLCGSVQGLPQFRIRLADAADRLKKCENPLLLEWHINRDKDELVYKKANTRVILIPEAAQRMQHAVSNHERGVIEAKQERRKTVC